MVRLERENVSNIPEMIKEEKDIVDSVFLRTVIRKDVYDRLKQFAQQYSTGRGDWDFGVAVQVLLEHYEDSLMSVQSGKIDMIINLLTTKPEPPKEDRGTEMLGGTFIPKEK